MWSCEECVESKNVLQPPNIGILTDNETHESTRDFWKLLIFPARNNKLGGYQMADCLCLANTYGFIRALNTVFSSHCYIAVYPLLLYLEIHI